MIYVIKNVDISDEILGTVCINTDDINLLQYFEEDLDDECFVRGLEINGKKIIITYTIDEYETYEEYQKQSSIDKKRVSDIYKELTDLIKKNNDCYISKF